jgi:hypothetical protein
MLTNAGATKLTQGRYTGNPRGHEEGTGQGSKLDMEHQQIHQGYG